MKAREIRKRMETLNPTSLEYRLLKLELLEKEQKTQFLVKDIVPWIAVLLSILALVKSGTDPSKGSTAEEATSCCSETHN